MLETFKNLILKAIKMFFFFKILIEKILLALNKIHCLTEKVTKNNKNHANNKIYVFY